MRRSARLSTRAKTLAFETENVGQDQLLRDTTTGQKTGQGQISSTRTIEEFGPSLHRQYHL